MVILPKAIGPVAVANGGAAALYISAANTTTVLTRASVANITAGAATLTLWIVRSGGAKADSNIVFGAAASGVSVAAGPSAPLILSALAGLVLGAGDALWGLSDTASALNFTASGWTQ